MITTKCNPKIESHFIMVITMAAIHQGLSYSKLFAKNFMYIIKDLIQDIQLSSLALGRQLLIHDCMEVRMRSGVCTCVQSSRACRVPCHIIHPIFPVASGLPRAVPRDEYHQQGWRSSSAQGDSGFTYCRIIIIIVLSWLGMVACL